MADSKAPQPETAQVERIRWCGCSRADNQHRQFRPSCVLHGVSPEARAYRAGVHDALHAGVSEVPEAFPVRGYEEDEYCRRCGGPNVIWAAASPLWNYVMRGNDINGESRHSDLVCIPCFIICGIQAGLPAIGWRLTIAPEPDGLIYETPSGRVWDAEKFLWVEPEVTTPPGASGGDDRG